MNIEIEYPHRDELGRPYRIEMRDIFGINFPAKIYPPASPPEEEGGRKTGRAKRGRPRIKWESGDLEMLQRILEAE